MTAPSDRGLVLTTDDGVAHVLSPTDTVTPDELASALGRDLTTSEARNLATQMLSVLTGADATSRGGTIQLAKTVLRLSAGIRAIVEDDGLTAGQVRKELAGLLGALP